MLTTLFHCYSIEQCMCVCFAYGTSVQRFNINASIASMTLYSDSLIINININTEVLCFIRMRSSLPHYHYGHGMNIWIVLAVVVVNKCGNHRPDQTTTTTRPDGNESPINSNHSTIRLLIRLGDQDTHSNSPGFNTKLFQFSI